MILRREYKAQGIRNERFQGYPLPEHLVDVGVFGTAEDGPGVRAGAPEVRTVELDHYGFLLPAALFLDEAEAVGPAAGADHGGVGGPPLVAVNVAFRHYRYAHGTGISL